MRDECQEGAAGFDGGCRLQGFELATGDIVAELLLAFGFHFGEDLPGPLGVSGLQPMRRQVDEGDVLIVEHIKRLPAQEPDGLEFVGDDPRFAGVESVLE